MLRSFHDGNLIAYAVDCETRQIRLSIRSEGDKTPQSVIFKGVEGYHFEHDAFGNIIYALKEVPIQEVLTDYAIQITEAYRLSGSPGPWAADLDSAGQVLFEKGMQGFELSSSYGLSGWIIASEVLVLPA